jgi:glutathione S-transferase
MKLYYSPGACSLASHIALEEGGADYQAVRVDLATHRTEAGEDFYAISKRGYVPALETDEGLLTENSAVLAYIGDKFGPELSEWDRYKIEEWIGFVGTEIHKSFSPIFAAKKGGDPKAAESARPKVAERFELAAQLLEGRDWAVADQPTVADNYLFVTTLWAGQMGIEIPEALQAYRRRNLERESVKKAMKAEGLTANA